MTIRPDTDELIAFLNELVVIDPGAVAALVETHHPCNQALAGHPTVQVDSAAVYRDPPHRVGMLGILNGYCGTIESGIRAGFGPITVVYEDGKLLRFERTRE